MPTPFEQQVIANTLAINNIISGSEHYGQLLDIPGGIQDTDVISVARLNNEGEIIDTYQVPFSEFGGGVQPYFGFRNVGVVPSLADNTTTNEIENRINEVGFEIASGEIKIIIAYIKIAGATFKVHYFYRPNSVGTYGNGNVPVTFNDLYVFEIEPLNAETVSGDNLIVIDLGDMGGNTIVNYINETTQQPEWDLEEGNIYAFKAIEDGSRNSYLYTGDLPRHLGLEDPNQVTNDDFELINNQGWYWAEDCWVSKQGNLDYTEIEIGDIVFFKQVVYNGRDVMMVGWRFLGGSKIDYNSYEKVLSII